MQKYHYHFTPHAYLTRDCNDPRESVSAYVLLNFKCDNSLIIAIGDFCFV